MINTIINVPLVHGAIVLSKRNTPIRTYISKERSDKMYVKHADKFAVFYTSQQSHPRLHNKRDLQ